MKKLLALSLLFSAMTIGCSTNKATTPVASAAPAANAAKPDMNEDFLLTKSLRAAKHLPYEESADNDNEEEERHTMHFEVKPGGPAFDLDLWGCEPEECETGIRFTRTDKPGNFLVKMHDSYPIDLDSINYADDFNFDGFTDLAFKGWEAGGDAIYFHVLIWNDKAEKFEYFLLHTNGGDMELCEENKTLVLNTSAYFGDDCPENCLNQYTFDGPKIIQKPWILPAPKPGAVRVVAHPNIIEGLEGETPLVTHMEYELREESNGVKAFLVSCDGARERAFYPDATLKGMEQKDVNGDGKIDLVFPSKSNPSKKIQAIWEEESRVFRGPENDEDVAVG